jgi:hypothetical protein
MSKLKHTKNTIYRLKQRMGLPIYYHIIDEHSVDPITGEKTTVLSVINIKKAVVLRAREFRSFVYDLAFISANKDFTTGGFFDPEDRRVLLQASDLNGHNPQIWDYFIFQNDRYDVKEVLEFENNYAFGLLARKVRGQNITRMVLEHSGLLLDQSASAVVVDQLTRSVVSTLTLTQNVLENP